MPAIIDGNLTIYAVAETGPEWRKLQPLLLSFAGPTLTDFSGIPSKLDCSEPFEVLLGGAGVHTAARLRPGRFKGGEVAVIRALRRLQARLLDAPDLALPRPEPTSRLLAQLQDSLNSGDTERAWRTLTTLGDELRLNAMNLAGLEIQILAAASDWNAIRWHPRFEALAYGSPTRSTAETLLEAIYLTLKEPDGQDAASVLDAATAPVVDALLRRAGNSTRNGVRELRALLDAGSPARQPDTSLPLPLPHRLYSETPEKLLDKAVQTLLVVAASTAAGDPDLDASAITTVNALNELERIELLKRPIFAAIWAELQDRLGLRPPPRDWSDWLSRLSDPHFDAPAYAVSGSRDWIIGDTLLDPATSAALAEALLGVTDGLAAERLADGLPFMLRWAKEDPQWPRPALTPVYLAMLTCMALGSRRGSGIMQSTGPLLEGALRCGLSIVEYRDALDAAGEIARSGLHRGAAFDVLEILETARSITPVEQVALDEFSLAIVSGLVVQSARLTIGQRQLLSQLAAEVGWSEPVTTSYGKAAARQTS
jgi:hypothetical protein